VLEVLKLDCELHAIRYSTTVYSMHSVHVTAITVVVTVLYSCIPEGPMSASTLPDTACAVMLSISTLPAPPFVLAGKLTVTSLNVKNTALTFDVLRNDDSLWCLCCVRAVLSVAVAVCKCASSCGVRSSKL
jgi:hypothetical protein